MNKIQKTDHFYLIDGSGYIFRAYYALPPLLMFDKNLPKYLLFCSGIFGKVYTALVIDRLFLLITVVVVDPKSSKTF